MIILIFVCVWESSSMCSGIHFSAYVFCNTKWKINDLFFLSYAAHLMHQMCWFAEWKAESVWQHFESCYSLFVTKQKLLSYFKKAEQHSCSFKPQVCFLHWTPNSLWMPFCSLQWHKEKSYCWELFSIHTLYCLTFSHSNYWSQHFLLKKNPASNKIYMFPPTVFLSLI